MDELRLRDETRLGKVLIRATPATAVTAALGLPMGRAARDPAGTLVVGAGPGEWLLLGGPPADAVARRLDAAAPDDLVTVVDFTSALALLRLTGSRSVATLAALCAVDLEAAATGSALRTDVAGVVTGVVREGDASFLLWCDSSYGRYLAGAILDAGAEHGIEIEDAPVRRG
jgi:heterotetrameric sarcosine oxidase gamma subunit